MKKKHLKITVLTLAMTFMSMQAFSFQSNSASKAPTQPAATAQGVATPPPGLPIDGFLIYLLIAGSVFGISKLRKKED